LKTTCTLPWSEAIWLAAMSLWFGYTTWTPYKIFCMFSDLEDGVCVLP
jgi:hypothetical protein